MAKCCPGKPPPLSARCITKLTTNSRRKNVHPARTSEITSRKGENTSIHDLTSSLHRRPSNAGFTRSLKSATRYPKIKLTRSSSGCSCTTVRFKLLTVGSRYPRLDYRITGNVKAIPYSIGKIEDIAQCLIC